MAKLKCYYILLLFVFSCSTEKINLSPIGENAVGETTESAFPPLSDRRNAVVYSSELTNLIASFPKFKNDAVNREISILKMHLRGYVGALKSFNMDEVDKAYSRYEKSYKKLQSLRPYLKKEDDEVLNRYLVRIKINMNSLQTNLPQDSSSLPFN